jgi:DNA recombination protein RmuC
MDALLPLLLGLLIGLALGALVGLLVARARRSGGAGESGSSTLTLLESTLGERTAALTETRSRVEQLVEERAGLQSRLAGVEATASGLRDQVEERAHAHREQLEGTTAAHREQAALAREQFEAQLTFAKEQGRERLEQQDAQYRAQIGTLEERLTDFQRRLKDVQDAEKSRAGEDSKVLVALSPVQESLKAVQAKVVELEAQRQQQFGELSQQLKSATESEERLRSTAESLASALRSNSTRGVWGETQLRSVVEAAGLIERVDFDVQTSIVSDSGAGRPDMVVHLPGGKNIAVDAKVPFDAYLEASAIQASATGVEGEHRTQLMKKHVKALREHITALGSKGYWTGLEGSPELVIAFIPSESLVSSALEADPSIMEFAFGKRVALASPVTLWSVLKTVAFSWQQDVLTQEARQLFDLSQQLYTRLGKTASHIDKLGRTIDRTVKDYNAFIGSFERQVFPTARKLGALSSESLFPELAPIEEAPREITGRELLAELEAVPEVEAVEPSVSESEAEEVPEVEPEVDADERAAEVERAVAEFDALGDPAAARDAAFLEHESSESAQVIDIELDFGKPTGTDPR